MTGMESVAVAVVVVGIVAEGIAVSQIYFLLVIEYAKRVHNRLIF